MRDSAELTEDMLRGKYVHLTAQDMEQAAPLYFQWSQDAEYMHLVDGDPPVPFSLKATKEGNERDWPEDDPCNIMFLIRANEDDRIIGFANLDYISWAHGDSYMGIGLGDKTCWGKGYGTDAMNLLLRYAFTELNLHRMTLSMNITSVPSACTRDAGSESKASSATVFIAMDAAGTWFPWGSCATSGWS